jgi:hypothetical protein
MSLAAKTPRMFVAIANFMLAVANFSQISVKVIFV